MVRQTPESQARRGEAEATKDGICYPPKLGNPASLIELVLERCSAGEDEARVRRRLHGRERFRCVGGWQAVEVPLGNAARWGQRHAIRDLFGGLAIWAAQLVVRLLAKGPGTKSSSTTTCIYSPTATAHVFARFTPYLARVPVAHVPQAIAV